VEIEDHLRRFRLASPPARLRRAVLAEAKPWRPWHLAVAAAALLACSAMNALSEARLHGLLSSGGKPDLQASPASQTVGHIVVSLPPSIRAESLVSLRRAMEVDGR